MRTRRFYKYLMAMIIALSTTVNAMAQTRYLKIYFNQYVEGATAPTMLVTDNNNAYDLPAGLEVSADGVAWAKEARFFEWINQDVSDRLLADYIKDENGNYYTNDKGEIYKKESHLKLSFKNFPYEVNMIRWNKMNDILSGSITDFFKNYGITTTCTPLSGSGFTHSEEHWAMNLFTHNASFSQENIPWKKENNKNVTLNGLTSFDINEAYDTKIGIGSWTWIDLGLSELSNKCRTFIKAGWNGKTGTASNIKDSDTKNWAFRVQFTLPDIRMRSYSCTVDNNQNIALGQTDNNIIVGEKKLHALKGYITAHAGAVVPTENPTDPNDFHYEYFANKDSLNIGQYSGLIKEAKLSGDVPVTVKLMRGEREVCFYKQIIHVYAVDPARAEICIGYQNGYKGFDLTTGVGKNQIEGYIVKYGKDGNGNDIVVTPTNDINDYHFEYSESSNGQIITINSITGQISAKKEGDVEISAVLKNGTKVASNTYTYTLHVFAQKEGLYWSRPNTYTYSTNAIDYPWWDALLHEFPYDVNPDNWKVTTTSGSASYDWKQMIKNTDDGQTIPYLNVNTSILENSSSQSGAGSDNWKQIAWFKTGSYNYWRAVSQRILFRMLVPKYSKVDGTFAFAGNVSIGSTNKGNCNYGFEVKDLGVVTADDAKTIIKNITWNTTNAGENVSSSSGSYSTTTLARKGVNSYNNGYVGDGTSNFKWSYDNSAGNESADQTRYLAVMAYLYRDYSYPGEFSVGYKGIPTYTYYSTITYYKNDGTNDVWKSNDWDGTETFTSTSKTKSFEMINTSTSLKDPKRSGYVFLGWSIKRDTTAAEYHRGDLFCPYDATNGGGKGPIDLYAVWSKIPDVVTLDPQGGTGGNTQTTALYGQKLPNGLTAPTKEGYEFKGYYSNANQEYQESTGENYGGKQYYDKDMVGVADWDYTYSGVTLYAHWAPKKFVVSFDGTNGAIVPKQMQYDSNKDISEVIYNSDGVLKISFKYGGQCPNKITNGKFKKAAFKLLGFYDSNDVLVASVKVDDPTDRNIYFNENSGYWAKKDGIFVWNCTHDVDLTARYEPKYTVRDGDIIDFGTEYLEVGIDWENSMVHDLLGAAEAEKEAGRISSTNPVMVFDIRNAKYLDGSSQNSSDLMVPLRDKDFISPNLLVYLGKGAYNVIENEIETDGTCPGLVVTDRFPIKIPTAFTASKASYARDAKVADDEKGKDQAKNSYWGTLCLPYPIKNNASGVKFYWLESTANNYMEFEEFGDNAIIPANTPVLYCRTDGGVGSMITIEEQSVGVPKNDTYTPVMIKYSDPQPGTYPLESASLTLQDWEFRGNLKTNVFCGKGYINPPAEAIANSDITDNGEVYYFKQNKFTRLTPLMTKNGTVYQAGKMILYPYRAYFYQKGDNSISAKVSDYSILVVGEDGSTTDITNAIFGEGEGDGKIYDLNGIRVMQPVKGRLYIVDGQKKVYR